MDTDFPALHVTVSHFMRRGRTPARRLFACSGSMADAQPDCVVRLTAAIGLRQVLCLPGARRPGWVLAGRDVSGGEVAGQGTVSRGPAAGW
jgi:hypothetical protein